MPLPRDLRPPAPSPSRRSPHGESTGEDQEDDEEEKVDPLTVSLKLLTLAVRESMRAIRFLNKAIMSPVQEPKIVNCTFKLHKKNICRPGHGRAGREDPRGRRRQQRCAGRRHRTPQCVDEDDRGRSRRVRGLARDPDECAARPMGGLKTIPVGCCIYSGGSIPNLTQSQCRAVQSDEMGSERPELHQLSEVAVAARSVPGTSHRTPVG